MTYTMKPLPFDPATMTGLSERLILSHYENNYGGAVHMDYGAKAVAYVDAFTLSLHKYRLPGDLRQLAKLRGNATTPLGSPYWRTC
jgi:hypothetical protein